MGDCLPVTGYGKPPPLKTLLMALTSIKLGAIDWVHDNLAN